MSIPSNIKKEHLMMALDNSDEGVKMEALKHPESDNEVAQKGMIDSSYVKEYAASHRSHTPEQIDIIMGNIGDIDNTNSIGLRNTITYSTINNNTIIWLRVTLSVNNGSSGNTTTFYTSSDGITWTQLGNTIINSGITSGEIDNVNQIICSGGVPGIINNLTPTLASGYAEISTYVKSITGFFDLSTGDLNGLVSYRDSSFVSNVITYRIVPLSSFFFC